MSGKLNQLIQGYKTSSSETVTEPRTWGLEPSGKFILDKICFCSDVLGTGESFRGLHGRIPSFWEGIANALSGQTSTLHNIGHLP